MSFGHPSQHVHVCKSNSNDNKGCICHTQRKYRNMGKWKRSVDLLVIIIMYIDHALISALSTQMIHINLNTIFYTHVATAILPKQFMQSIIWKHTHTHARTHARTHTRTHACTHVTHTHTHGLNQSEHATWHLFPKTKSAADNIYVCKPILIYHRTFKRQFSTKRMRNWVKNCCGSTSLFYSYRCFFTLLLLLFILLYSAILCSQAHSLHACRMWL